MEKALGVILQYKLYCLTLPKSITKNVLNIINKFKIMDTKYILQI